MDHREQTAIETGRRQTTEDAIELIQLVTAQWYLDGRLNMLVSPILAVASPSGVTVLMSDESRLVIPMGEPENAKWGE